MTFSTTYPYCVALSYDPTDGFHENEVADWLHRYTPGEWDMTFDHERKEVTIHVPTASVAVLFKLTWGGAA